MSSRFCLTAAATAAVLLTAAASEAQQTFNVVVPVRVAGLPQIASVKIVFEKTTGNIANNPNVTIDDQNASGNETVAAVACGAFPTCDPMTIDGLGTFGPNNADGSLVHWVSPTKLMVVLNFGDLSGGLCGARPEARSINITLTNVAADHYRMASYGVPFVVTGPGDPRCNNPFRRINVDPATLGGSIVNDHRLPLDIVLVLDKSGSMSLTLPNGPVGVTRWDRLKASVGQFMALFKQATAVLADGSKVEGAAEDRIGLVFFDSTAQKGILENMSIFKARGAMSTGWDGAGGPLTDIITQKLGPPLPGVMPGGSTSIGAGLTLAFNCLQFPEPACTGMPLKDRNDATIVVFTDGEQNTPPCVRAPGEMDAFMCPTTAKQPLQLGDQPLFNRQTPILTIGFGAAGTSFAALLDRISQDTAGQSRVAMDTLALDTHFADSLIAALKGNTLSLLKRQTEPLAAATPAGTVLSTIVDGSIPRVVFVAGWEGQSVVDLQIKNPAGTVVTPATIVRAGSYIVASVDTQTPASVGQWQAQLVRPAAPPPNTLSAVVITRGDIRYHLSAYAVEGRLDYRFTIKPGTIGTGEPVVVRAEVGYDGKRIDKLPAGAIRVTVARPDQNLGNLLNASAVTGAPQNEGGQPQSAVSAKIDQLAMSQNLADQITPKPLPNVLNMTEVAAGVYEASFDQTVVGGQYRFRVDMNWNDPRTNQIVRSEIVEQHVPVLPSEQNTDVQLAQSSANAAQISVAPKDRFGNFVGPGYGPMFTVTVDAPAVVGAIGNPNVNGTYVIPITGIPAGADPHVKISFGDLTLRDSALSKVTQPGGGGPGGILGGLPMWLLILIVVVALILIAFFAWKKAHP